MTIYLINEVFFGYDTQPIGWRANKEEAEALVKELNAKAVVRGFTYEVQALNSDPLAGR